PLDGTSMLTLAESSDTHVVTRDRFETLFEHFYSELYGLVYRVLGERMAAEDVVQEAFLKLSDDPLLQQRPDPEVGAWLRRRAVHPTLNRPPPARRARARLPRLARLARGGGGRRRSRG